MRGICYYIKNYKFIMVLVKYMNSVELTTMCAILDATEENVLCIRRNGHWPGWAFPGGHLETRESFFECMQREIEEETGVRLSSAIFKGITDIFNTETQDRHIIMNYLARSFEGMIKRACDEGEIAWIPRRELGKLPLAEGMELRLPIFFDPGVKELYIEWDEARGYTRVEQFDL